MSVLLFALQKGPTAGRLQQAAHEEADFFLCFCIKPEDILVSGNLSCTGNLS